MFCITYSVGTKEANAETTLWFFASRADKVYCFSPGGKKSLLLISTDCQALSQEMAYLFFQADTMTLRFSRKARLDCARLGPCCKTPRLYYVSDILDTSFNIWTLILWGQRLRKQSINSVVRRYAVNAGATEMHSSGFFFWNSSESEKQDWSQKKNRLRVSTNCYFFELNVTALNFKQNSRQINDVQIRSSGSQQSRHRSWFIILEID